MAAKNILLIDSICQSGLDSRTVHSMDLQKAINSLIYYTSFEENMDENLNDTKQILHLRIKPSSRGNENNSIETMAYVAKDDTLWCGHGSHVKIYEMEAITISHEIGDHNLNERITCLVYDPVESKIWIGTMDYCITVMDVETRSINKKIKQHSDVVVSIALFNKFK